MLFYLTFECNVNFYIVNLNWLIITLILCYSIGYVTPPICTLPIKTYYKWNIHYSYTVIVEDFLKTFSFKVFEKDIFHVDTVKTING